MASGSESLPGETKKDYVQRRTAARNRAPKRGNDSAKGQFKAPVNNPAKAPF